MKRALLLLLLALLATSARADFLPDEVSLMVGTHHIGGRDDLRSSTPGVALSWKLPLLAPRAALDVAVYANSQGHTSALAAFSREWRAAGPLFVGLGAGVVYGYRAEVLRPNTAGLCLYGPGCAPDRAYGTPGWMPTADLRARLMVGGGYSLGLTFVPARVLAKAFKTDGREHEANAVSLWLRKEWN